jgi:hypothetical protein
LARAAPEEVLAVTTIAFKDGVIAADRLICASHERYGTTTKIGLTKDADGIDCAWGASGRTALSQRFERWAREGLPKGEPAPSMKEGEGEAHGSLFYADGRVVTYDPDIPSGSPLRVQMAQVHGSYVATMGSGGEYALGAMAAGADAKQAVEIACLLDVSSGAGVDVLRLPTSAASPPPR